VRSFSACAPGASPTIPRDTRTRSPPSVRSAEAPLPTGAGTRGSCLHPPHPLTPLIIPTLTRRRSRSSPARSSSCGTSSRQLTHCCGCGRDATRFCPPSPFPRHKQMTSSRVPRPVGGVGSRARSRPLHPCPRCGKTFTKRSNMIIHERLHTGEMPYTCRFPGCGKKYKWLSSINFHENRCTLKTPAPGPNDDDDAGRDVKEPRADLPGGAVASQPSCPSNAPNSTSSSSGKQQAQAASQSNASPGEPNRHANAASRAGRNTRICIESTVVPAKNSVARRAYSALPPRKESAVLSKRNGSTSIRQLKQQVLAQVQARARVQAPSRVKTACGKSVCKRAAPRPSVPSQVTPPITPEQKQSRTTGDDRQHYAMRTDNPGSPESLLSSESFELGGLFSQAMLSLTVLPMCGQAPMAPHNVSGQHFTVPISPMTPPGAMVFAQQRTDSILDEFSLAGVDLFPGGGLVSHCESAATATHDGVLMGEVFGVVPPSVFPMDSELSNDTLLF
jgi:hypothetical protein